MTDILKSKGMFLWKIKNAEEGDPARIAEVAFEAGLTHVLIKIADGPWNYNLRPYYVGSELRWADDIIQPLVDALHARGIEAWGWQYIYMINPVVEGQVAAARVKKFNLDGFVFDVEGESKNKPVQTGEYIKAFGDPGVPTGFSSYRWPVLHPEIDYKKWVERSDIMMPQVYWMKATNAGAQLQRSINEYDALMSKYGRRQFVPTGAAFWQDGWTAKPAETLEFMTVAKASGIQAFNFWEHYFARKIDGMWSTISQFKLIDAPPPPPDDPGSVSVDDFVRDEVYPWMKEDGYDGPRPV